MEAVDSGGDSDTGVEAAIEAMRNMRMEGAHGPDVTPPVPYGVGDGMAPGGEAPPSSVHPPLPPSELGADSKTKR